MFDRDRTIAQLLAVLAGLGWTPPTLDVLDLLDRGALLSVPQAAIICGVTSQTILDWIEDAARMRRPFAKKRSTWMVDTEKLFAYVEKHRGGRQAREHAEKRLTERWPQWSQSNELSAAVKERVAG
jgi:hypothetical protein